MPVFNNAKTEFNSTTQKAPEKVSGDWGNFRNYVKAYLETKHDEIESFASKINYPGHDRDKSAYVNKLGKHVKTMLTDKNATKEEILNFFNQLHQSSEKIINTLQEKQKAYEVLLYGKVEKEIVGDYKKGNFEQVIKKLNVFRSTLCPLNTTNSYSNANIDILNGLQGAYSFGNDFDYKNPQFKLDIIIEKRILDLREQKQMYQKVLKKGVYLKGRKNENYIMGKDKNGNIILGDVYWNGEEIVARKMDSEVKINWRDLLTEIEKNKYRLQKVRVVDNEGIRKTKDFQVEIDPEIKMERAKIREAQYLKQINYIFNSREFVESMGLSEARKPLVVASIKEIFNSMGEFFYNSGENNTIFPQTKFDNLNDIQKVFLIKEIFIKIQQSIKRKETEKKIEKEKNPHLKAFHVAEVAMMNGDYMKAYSHARKFIRAATGNNMEMRYLPSSGTMKEINTIQTPLKKTNILFQKIPTKKILQAKLLINRSSVEIIKVAERYLASLKNSKVGIQHSKDTIKYIKKVMKSGQANNLHDAFKMYEDQLKKDLEDGAGYAIYKDKFDRMRQNPLFTKMQTPGVMKQLNMLNKPYFSRSNILRELTLSTEAKTEKGRIGYLTGIAKETALHGLGKYSKNRPGASRLNLPNGKGPRISTQSWYTDGRQINAANVLFQTAMVEDIKKMRRIEQNDPNHWKEIKNHREALLKDSDFYKEAEKLAKMALKKKGEYTQDEYKIAVENSKKLLMKLKIKQFEKGKILENYIGYAKSQITPKYKKFNNAPLFDMNQGTITFPEEKWKPQYLNAVKGYFDTHKQMAKTDKDWQDMENLFYNEMPLTIAMLAISGGVANVARASIGAATRNVLGRIIATEGGKRMIPFVAESLAFMGEVGTFETSMRTMQYARSGDKKLFKLKGEHGLINGYFHAAALFGMLKLGGRFVTPLLAKGLTPFKGIPPAQMTAFKKFAQKYTPRAVSMAGVEAPILAGFDMVTGNPENKSFMQIYLKYLRELPAIAGGGHMFNSATGLNRVITRLDTRSKIFDLRHSSVANKREQGIALEKILENGEVPYETVFQWAQMKMSSKQVKDLAGFMTDSANQAFIAAIKADKQARMKSPEAKKMSEALINRLVKLGFSKAVAKRIIDAAPIDLISKYKEKVFSNKAGSQKGFILNPFTSGKTKLADTRNVFEITGFQGKSHQQIADVLIKEGKISLLNENIHQLKGLNVKVAKKLIQAGHGETVTNYIDHFKGDYKVIFKHMIATKGYYFVHDLIFNKKFRDQVDHQYILDKLIEKGFTEMTSDVLPLLKNVDHNKLAWQLIKSGNLDSLLFSIHNFKNLDKEIFVEFIKNDSTRALNENLDSFGCSRKELAEALLKLGYDGEYFLLNNSSLFKNTIDFNILVKRFIDKGDYKTLSYFLDNFQGHKVQIPKEVIDYLRDSDYGDVSVEKIARNINLFKGVDQKKWISSVVGYWGLQGIASRLYKYKDLDHVTFAKQLVETGNTDLLIQHLKYFKKLPPDFLKPIFEQLVGGSTSAKGNILKAAAINNYVKKPFDKTLKGVYDLFGETTNLFLYNTFKQLEGGEMPAAVKALGINKTGNTGINQLRVKLREIRSELINGTANVKQIADNRILYRWLMKLVRYKKAENFVATDARDDARFSEILNNYLKHEKSALKLPAGYEKSGELLIQTNKQKNMSLEFTPQRNILTEFSGFLGDACYFQNKGSLIKEHSNVVSVTMVKNPGQKSEVLVGNILLIETRGYNGDPLLVVRGLNPQQNTINQLNMRSFYNETMSYLHKIVRRRGRKLAIVIENRANRATTNRPNLFAFLKAKKPNLQHTYLKWGVDSTINKHNITDKTFLVKSSESVDMTKLKPETKQKVDTLEAQLKKRGVLGQTENIDTYLTTRTINNIEKPQAFQRVMRVKDSIIAFNEKGKIQVFENSTAYEGYLDSHKLSKEKLIQKTEIPTENADKHTVDGETQRFVDSDLPTIYEKLKQLKKKDLVKYGITKPRERERFKKYVQYVGRIEKQLAKFEKQFANDRKTLEVIMNELAIVHNAIHIRKVSLKGRVRMARKLLKELNGQFEKLTDAVRGSLTFSNHRDLYRALRSLKANPNVRQLQIKDFLNIRNSDGSFNLNIQSKHESGFRHINAKIRLKSGHVVELQLHLKETYKAAIRGVEIPTGILNNIRFTVDQKALFEKIARRINEDGSPLIEFPDFSQPRISIKEQDIYNILREIRTKKSELTQTERGLMMNLKHLSREVYNYSWKIYKAKNIP